jgi:hypothetical protein
LKIFLRSIVFLLLLQGVTYAKSALITWNDNSDNEDGFVIERTIRPDCSDDWQVIGYTGVNQTSLVDIYIPSACYRVAAYNADGISERSNIAKAYGFSPDPVLQTWQDRSTGWSGY